MISNMIKNFKSKAAQDIYNGDTTHNARKIPLELHEKIGRVFDQLNAVTRIETLRIPPSNKLEKLSGNLEGYSSLRINKQWRIIFRWDNTDAIDVDIVDYH